MNCYVQILATFATGVGVIPYHGCALPTELSRHNFNRIILARYEVFRNSKRIENPRSMSKRGYFLRFLGPKRLEIKAPTTAPLRFSPASKSALTRPGASICTASSIDAIAIAVIQAKSNANLRDGKVQQEARTRRIASTKCTAKCVSLRKNIWNVLNSI